jgi:hypothetical protein
LRTWDLRFLVLAANLALGAALGSEAVRWAEAREALDQADAIFQELGAKLDLDKIDELDAQLASGSTTTFGERSEGDV